MKHKKSTQTLLAFLAILLLVTGTVASNYMEKAKIDDTRLPEKIENSEGFQRWIINLKKRMEINADEFELKDKNQIFSGAYLTVTRLEDSEIEDHIEYLESFKNNPEFAFSPNSRQFIDYRHENRTSKNGDFYEQNEAHYYGLNEDSLIDARALSCLRELNCYLDRAYFLDNHTFVISEISRNGITKAQAEDGEYERCEKDELCTYTFKLHFFDLINNSRTVYESAPLELVLNDTIQYF